MGIRATVAVIGAAAILLAATALVVDIQRGAPHDIVLAPASYEIAVVGSYAREPGDQDTFPLCAPDCQGPSHVLELTVRGLPRVAAFSFDVDGHDVRISADGDDFIIRVAGPGDGPAELIIRSPEDSLQIRLEPGAISETGALQVFIQEAQARIEQIGAVGVSTLVDLRVDAEIPPGMHLVAWFDEVRLGALDEGAFDDRIDAVAADDHAELVVTLESRGDPPVRGTIVWRASLHDS